MLQQCSAVSFQRFFLRSSGIKAHHQGCWLRASAGWACNSAEQSNLSHECGSAPLSGLHFGDNSDTCQETSFPGVEMEEMGCGGVNVISDRPWRKPPTVDGGAWADLIARMTWICAPHSGKDSFLSSASSSLFRVLLSVSRTKLDGIQCTTGLRAVDSQLWAS